MLRGWLLKPIFNPTAGTATSSMMDNLKLFALINASSNTPHWQLAIAVWIAQWLIWCVPLAMAAAWVRGDDEDRSNLLEMLVAALFALGLAQVVTHAWPQPRPFMLHLGRQLLAHDADPGLPSDHVTVFWSIAAAALAGTRFRPWGLVLFSLGLLVGWSRVFLGIHFPLDVLAALPASAAGAMLARALRAQLWPVYALASRTWDRAAHPFTRR
ncbi:MULTISPECIES: undecaprenyl-diphosphatase [Ramlibacter]|uniref:Undecaprenyl-diphosphatase n=1 Tax=Ramlibacter aquaticus TaxID=2780094 RepID=A0ABR9SCP2_9BURK|nr:MULTISPECIES: undecaprenyl-diphosphatase [Ramlibacter]MBE7940123.1 undecaprenyl-diphosphatase [Ramlibacter aquaticus]